MKKSSSKMDIKIIQQDGKKYLSMGVCELAEAVKLSRRKIFQMIDSGELESRKDGKYRLVIFNLDESKFPIEYIKKLIEINNETKEMRTCGLHEKSILDSILDELEIRKMKKEYTENNNK